MKVNKRSLKNGIKVIVIKKQKILTNKMCEELKNHLKILRKKYMKKKIIINKIKMGKII